MLKKVTILSILLATSTSFAASEECTKKLDGLLMRVKEGTRLYSAAVTNGFNVYTGEVEQMSDQSKHANSYMTLSLKNLEEAKQLETELIRDCLK